MRVNDGRFAFHDLEIWPEKATLFPVAMGATEVRVEAKCMNT